MTRGTNAPLPNEATEIIFFKKRGSGLKNRS